MHRLSLDTPDAMRPFAALDTPIWVFDTEAHGIWWANRRAVDFWRAPDLETLLQRDFSTDSESVRRRLQQLVQASVDAKAPIKESWTLYPCGTPVRTLLAFQPVRLGASGSGVLIELLRTLDETVDAESLRMVEAARATALAVSTFSLDGVLLARNPAAAALHSAHPELLDPEAAAKVPGPGTASDLRARFIDPEMATRILDRVRADQMLSCEAMVRLPHGELRWHLVTARRGRDPINGAPVAILTEEDITEQTLLRQRQMRDNQRLEGDVKDRTSRLRVSEARFALAAEMAAIWDWDIPSNRLFLSPTFGRSLGYEDRTFRDTLRADGVEGLLMPDDIDTFHAAVERHVRQPDHVISEELRFMEADGGLRWYHCQGRMLCDERGAPMRSVGILTDVTERKVLQASLLASQRLEAIGQLTGGIAHDFNNLLTVIQGNAQLLQELGQPDDQLLSEIVRAVRRGAELTSHLLSFARRQTLSPRRCRLDLLLDGMRHTLLRTLGEHVEVRIETAEDLWPLYVDPGQLEAAMLNIAINARDAMPDGGQLVIAARNVVLGSERPATHALVPQGSQPPVMLAPGGYVELTVTDTGRGMLPETLAKAFEPFFTTKGVGRGSGLGLSMVLGFSRQSGGDTRIESVAENGTRVSLILPRAQVDSDLPDRGPARTAFAQVPRGDGEHIHLLEDNTSVQSALARMLAELGYRVSTSTTANAALQASQMRPAPALYLVDVVLPGGRSGLDFARALHAATPQARVILMSGYPGGDLSSGQNDAVDAGLAQAFLGKPIDRAQLAQAIRTALEDGAETAGMPVGS